MSRRATATVGAKMIGCFETTFDAGDYAQCALTKGFQRQVAWIPLDYAKVGLLIKIKVDGVWDYGWTVQAVYGREYSDKLRSSDEFRRRMKTHSSIAKDNK